MKITFYVGSDISETTETNWPVAVPGSGSGNGDPGLSAYEIALQNGFSGDELDWLASLVGTPGQGITVLAFAKADQAGFDAALAAHAGNPLVLVIRRNV